MSTLTSEQAITALEHSSKPTVELLDDAATIVGFSSGESTHKANLGHSLSLGSENVKFREQWILRWIIKRLNQSTDVKHTPAERLWELLSDLRTWALLKYLLSTIPKTISKDILLERNFCRILSTCLATVNKFEDSQTSVGDKVIFPEQLDQKDRDDDRPSKRRRVSRDRSISEHPLTQSKFRLLTSILQVANQIAENLSVLDNKDLVHRTCVISNWAASVDEAAIFIAQVTTAASFMFSSLSGRFQHEESVIADLAETLLQWIKLWQTTATAAPNQRKQDPCVAFTNHALIPALDILAKKSVGSMKTVSQAFERQIALYSVLPMRSVFQKRFASTWNSWETEPQAQSVHPVLEAMNASLGDAAADFGTPTSASRVMTLMQIASRLIPRSDMIKRKAERSWVEALFLCLSCQPYAPSSNDKSLHNGSYASSTTPLIEEKPFTPIIVSNTYLDALQGTGIEPSIHFWRFYIRHALFEAPRDVPVETLAKIVRVNASAFVPGNTDADLSSLNTLCAVLAESLSLDDQSSDATLNNVIAPIVEDFGRTRQLDVFIKFWESKLMDAFFYRTGTMVEHPYHALWDHPTMLEIFSLVCQRHASPSLCINLLEVVVEDFAGLPEIVGPTHEKFARITILSAMLKPLGISPTVQAMFNAQNRPVINLIHNAILRSTDYQGHRWRLWHMLELCILLFPSAPRTNNLLSSGLTWESSPLTALKDLEPQTVQAKSKYLEGYQWFSFVISSYENLKDDDDPTWTGVIGTLNNLIQLCVKHSVSDKITSDFWDGVVGTMDNLFKVVSVCLTRFARSSVAWSSTETVPEDFLTNLASLTFSQNETGRSCLAIAAEAILTRITTSTKMSLIDTYVGPLSKNVTADTIPSLLHSATQELADEHQTQELIEGLRKVMEEANLESHEAFTSHLSLINNSLLRHSDSATTALDLTSYVKFLERSTSDAELEQLVSAYQFMQQTMRLVFARIEVNWHSGETEPGLEKLLQSMKELLTEMDASEESKLLNTYTGYLSLVVACIVHDLDLTSTPKGVRKVVEKIKKRHGSVVLKQCALHLKAAPSVINLWRIFVLLDSLVRPQDDKSFNKELQECLQKVVQAILAMDTSKSEGIASTQEVGIVAKLWHILNKYMKASRSKPLPAFPHASFTRILSQRESTNAVEVQAQLAASFPTQASIISLAHLTKLSNVEEQPQTSDDESDVDSAPFMSIAAKIRNLVLKEASTDAKTVEVLGHIACLQTAVNEDSPASLIARLELSKLVLEKHPSVINQHVIDSTLKSITLLASSSSKAVIATEAAQLRPEHIFDRLCAILSTLLVRYRRRLAGRYHLFLPVLQNLLKCLFYPSSRKHLTNYSSSKVTYLAALPSWLNPPTHTSTATLPSPSAIKFSRILQQLCDPSASSARHVSKRVSTPNDNLVDEVKSLRREVSQHTQYLLQTYCQVMLDGSIVPEVKEKLLPGLYAVMNATDVEIMRALNTAMDASQRAIWKDLYAEWKTYGRWNQR